MPGAPFGPALVPACLQVYMAPDGNATQYGSILVMNKRIKQDLVLSADGASLYAMSQDKVGSPGEQ